VQKISHRLNIGIKIGLGFGIVTAILGGIVFIALKEFKKAYVLTENIVELRVPTSRASLEMLNGINHSLAALRGWILLGEEKFKLERVRAWTKEIDISLNDLKDLSDSWTNPKNRERLTIIQAKLEELKRYQREIQLVAHKTENYPARKLLLIEAIPLADIMLGSITKIIDLEVQQPATSKRKIMFGKMADIRGTTARSLANIRAYLLSGNKNFKDKFDLQWIKNTLRFGELTFSQDMLTPEQRTLFKEYSDARTAFDLLPPKMFKIRESKEWNTANRMLGTQAAPTAFAIKELLDEMVANQQQLLNNDINLSNDFIEDLNMRLMTWLLFTLVLIGFIGVIITRNITSSISHLTS